MKWHKKKLNLFYCSSWLLFYTCLGLCFSHNCPYGWIRVDIGCLRAKNGYSCTEHTDGLHNILRSWAAQRPCIAKTLEHMFLYRHAAGNMSW